MEKNVMAVVNGVEILESDVDRFIDLMGNRALPYKNPEGKKQLCEELIKQELIIQDCYNMCPSKEVGGDLGEFTQGQMVLEFENACIDSEVGKVSEPVKTQFGYHLIKLESKVAPEQLSLEEVKDEIEKSIIKAKEQIAYVSKMDSLMKASKVERNY